MDSNLESETIKNKDVSPSKSPETKTRSSSDSDLHTETTDVIRAVMIATDNLVPEISVSQLLNQVLKDESIIEDNRDRPNSEMLTQSQLFQLNRGTPGSKGSDTPSSALDVPPFDLTRSISDQVYMDIKTSMLNELILSKTNVRKPEFYTLTDYRAIPWIYPCTRQQHNDALCWINDNMKHINLSATLLTREFVFHFTSDNEPHKTDQLELLSKIRKSKFSVLGVGLEMIKKMIELMQTNYRDSSKKLVYFKVGFDEKSAIDHEDFILSSYQALVDRSLWATILLYLGSEANPDSLVYKIIDHEVSELLNSNGEIAFNYFGRGLFLFKTRRELLKHFSNITKKIKILCDKITYPVFPQTVSVVVLAIMSISFKHFELPWFTHFINVLNLPIWYMWVSKNNLFHRHAVKVYRRDKDKGLKFIRDVLYTAGETDVDELTYNIHVSFVKLRHNVRLITTQITSNLWWLIIFLAIIVYIVLIK